MLIKSPSASAARECDVTPESVYLSRRRFMAGAAGALALGSLPVRADNERYAGVEPGSPPGWLADKLSQVQWQSVTLGQEALTPYKDVTSYNNFYEFGTSKGDPARYAGKLEVEPWTVLVDGEVAKPGPVALEQLVQPYRLEERIYRLRCVEAWSMVIPWLGFPLADLLKRAEPTGNARYVRFETRLAQIGRAHV